MTLVQARARKVSTQEAAKELGISKSWLDKRRLDGDGPPYFKFGRRVVYDTRDLEEWAEMALRRHNPRTP